MISLFSLLTFLGFYFWYCTTKRIAIQNIFGIEKWIKNNALISKFLGGLFFIASCIFHMYVLGFGSGAFTFFIVLMTIGSLIILLTPMRLLSYGSLFVTLIISLSIELKLF